MVNGFEKALLDVFQHRSYCWDLESIMVEQWGLVWVIKVDGLQLVSLSKTVSNCHDKPSKPLTSAKME